MFLRKGVLKIYSKFTGKDPCRSIILIKLLCNIFSGHLLLRTLLDGCFCLETSCNFVSGKWTETPLKSYHIKSGEKYRFRVIHPGTVFPLRVSTDGHMLSIISMDGYNVVPMSFESFIINPGERFDFILSADQPTMDYWIRVDGMEVHFQKLLSLKSQVKNLIFSRLPDHQLDVLTFSRRAENTSRRK